MIRKLCILAVLFSVFFVANCGPDSGPYKESAETGNYFYVSIDPKAGGFGVTSGGTIDMPMTDVTFVSEPVGSYNFASDVFMTSYDLAFVPPPDCTVAECPALSPIKGISIFQEVLAGGDATVIDVPMALASTYIEFLTNTSATDMKIYTVIATFHGENEFGYDVDVSCRFGLLLVP